jgi:transcriptional regulator with XRE-family HTH domain
MNSIKDINFVIDNTLSLIMMEYRKEDLMTALKSIREDKKVTQKQVADFLSIGNQQYYKLEKGENEISLKQFFQVLDFLEIGLIDVLKVVDKDLDLSHIELKILKDVVQYIESKFP